jgi:CRP-like cAMP-binding protein
VYNGWTDAMPANVAKLLAKGKALEGKGKRDKALDVYRDACRAEPYDPDVWTARGEAARALGMLGEAAESLFHVCELFARGGMPEDALKVLRRVLEINPDHGGARRLRHMLEGRVAAAEAPAPSPPPAASPPPEPTPEPPAPPEASSSALPALSAESSTVPIDDLLEIEPAPPPAAPPPPPRPRNAPRPPAARAPSSGPLAREPGSGAADIALDTLSLAERLPSSPGAADGAAEIPLEEEGPFDVVQAVASTLTSSPLLSELDSDLVRMLIDCGKLVHRRGDEIVFRQGDLGTSLFLILAGEVAVIWESRSRGGPDSRELARLRPGAFFGEMALLTNTGRSATVMALRNSDFLEISRRSVRELVDREPRVLKLLMRFFRARLVGTLLATSELFKPFTREERRDLIGRFRLRELAAEHLVIAEGGLTDGLFIVLVGKLEVLQALKSSHKKGNEGGGLSVLLGTLGPGDVFGEMSLLDGSPAMASVRTRTRAWLLLLPRADYEEIVARHPQIREHLAAVAAERRERNQAAATAEGQSYREERLEPV